MATKSGSLSPSNSTTTYIRAWVSWLSLGIVEVGWVQTSDTGQCDASAIPVPAAVNTPVGYHVFRMADALQATAPVFVKLEYGSGSAVNNPAIWVTIGTGSDGAGNLTGIRLSRTQISGGGTTSPMTCYMSGSLERMAVSMFTSSGSTYSQTIIIERTHDAVGGNTSDGLTVLWAFGSTKASQYLPFTGTIPTAYANWNVTTPPSGNGALSPNVYFFPIRCWSPGETFPILGAIAYISGDAATGGTYSVQGFDGSSRTYLALGAVLNAAGYGSANNLVAMRYD